MAKQKEIKKPEPFLYYLGCILAKIYLKVKCHTTYDKEPLKELKKGKKPAIVVAGHISILDFLLVGSILFPLRPTYIVSQHFMANKKIRFLFEKKLHAIPKKMFCPDIKTIMNIMRAKDSGNVIVMFPEGRLTATGHSLPVAEGTAELIKKLGIDVYAVSGDGAYKTFPKWGKAGVRSGKINVRSEKIINADDLKTLTTSEIESLVEKAIFHDEDSAFEDVIYKTKKPALGLDGILYKCPECKEEFTMSTNNREIFCTCGFRTELKNDYTFTNGPFKKINDWYFWQVDEIDINKPIETETIIATPDEDGIMNWDSGRGTIRMDRENISYKGTLNGEEFEFTEKTLDIKGIPISVNHHFDVYNKKVLYNFIPIPEKRVVIKWTAYMDKVVRERKEK